MLVRTIKRNKKAQITNIERWGGNDDIMGLSEIKKCQEAIMNKYIVINLNTDKFLKMQNLPKLIQEKYE